MCHYLLVPARFFRFFLLSNILLSSLLTSIRGRMTLSATWFVILPTWSNSRLLELYSLYGQYFVLGPVYVTVAK
jgi:hypothetical protein